MKYVYFLVMALSCMLQAKSQSVDKCQALNYFLASDSVKSLLAFDNNKVTWFHDTGSADERVACNCGYNGNRSFKWVSDSLMAKLARSKNCAYYDASCIRKGAGWEIAIRQVCSGLVCQGYVSGNKQRLTASSFIAFVK